MATALQVRPLMAEDPRRNNLEWRVAMLERQLQALQDTKPDVLADRLANLSQRFNDFRIEMKEMSVELREAMVAGDHACTAEVRSFKRIFVSVATGAGIAIVGAVIAVVLAGQ